VWRRDSLGRRYQNGLWSKCELAPVIAEWDKRTDCGLLISGSMGTGKTVAMGLMMSCLAARNEWSFCWWNMASLPHFSALVARLGRRCRARCCVLAHALVSLFVPGRSGVEYNSPLAMSRFNELIETRYARELLHVGTSNLNESALVTREGWQRIIDRMQESVLDWCEIGGESNDARRCV
jgi:predicted ATPase